MDNIWYVQLYTNQFPSVNDWHHFVITKRGTNLDIYLDGVMVGSLTTYGYSNFIPTMKFGSVEKIQVKVLHILLENKMILPFGIEF